VPDAAEKIRGIVAGEASRREKARAIADAIRELGSYRWVGVYDVDPEFVSIIAFSGPGAPAFPSFPVTKGLTSAAIRDKAPVIVGDVRNDPRYLTALGNTLSEIIIPVLHPSSGKVIGTVDVESERTDAFTPDDAAKLKSLSDAALPLWTAPRP
jgi:putative methionine-R-sulfoxide reductase with GAF domain